ncbi:multidrug transporter [Photobacterium aquae]|uniref:Multidrug transporter n=1 Tax=Photobacterium aquae TaxID=1195763 RepID=A0A0J1GXE9_9GAMM|nr:MFS transporter [Photobacterium aquae]KLV04119.1 multidrug transporter [Photobacterium aquae]
MRNYHQPLLNLGHALNHYIILIFPTVIIAISEAWQTHYADLLQLGSWGMLAYGLGALPAGWLGDRWGHQKMMVLFFFGTGISAILTTLAHTPQQLALGIVAIGLFSSIYHPVGMALLFQIVRNKGRAVAVNGVAGNIGLACASITTALLTSHYGWQYAFLVPGMLSCFLGGVYAWTSQRLSGKANTNTEMEQNTSTVTQPLRLFTIIAIIAAAGGLLFQSTTTALPKILNVTFNANLNQTGTLSTVIFLVAAIAQIGIGELIGKVSTRILLTVITAGQCLFLLMAAQSSEWSLTLSLAGFLFFVYAQIPVNDWLIGRYAHSSWRARLYALKYTLSFSTGPIAYWLIAQTYQTTGHFIGLYHTLSCIAALSLAAAVSLPRMTNVQTSQHSNKTLTDRHH